MVPTTNISNPPVILSFFSGLGFLDLGFEKAGFEIVFVNEKHRSFLEGYKHARNLLGVKKPELGYYLEDITDFSKDNKKRSELYRRITNFQINDKPVGFIGGPPCPDFSIGGKNKGREGNLGQLSHVYVDIISHQQPDFFLFENVKGLWQTRRHRQYYEELKDILHSSGYSTTDKLINSIEYGVPQDRPRIILIGFRNDYLHKLILNPVSNTTNVKRNEIPNFPWDKHALFPGKSAFNHNWPDKEPFNVDFNRPIPKGIPKELTVEHWFNKNRVYDHPNSGHCFKPRAGLARFMSVEEGDSSRKSFKRLHRWKYSPTACYGNNEVHLHPYKARRISAAEALSIQSLPKEFQLPENMSLSDMFKGIGNGVPYLAAFSIANTILDYIGVEL